MRSHNKLLLLITLFIYWPCWVFSSARAFSAVAESRGHHSLVVVQWVSCCREQTLGRSIFKAVARGLHSCPGLPGLSGSRAQAQ